MLNSIKIKHIIAKSCYGNIKKYFKKIEIVNKLLKENCCNLTEIEFLNKVNKQYLKQLNSLN